VGIAVVECRKFTVSLPLRFPRALRSFKLDGDFPCRGTAGSLYFIPDRDVKIDHSKATGGKDAAFIEAATTVLRRA
jgi:hypothetical protein